MIPAGGGESTLAESEFVDYFEVSFPLDEQTYWVRWYVTTQHTFCSVWGRNKAKPFCVGGFAVRKPGDAFNAYEGMRASARRACGVGEDWPARRMSSLYSQVRKWLQEEEARFADLDMAS